MPLRHAVVIVCWNGVQDTLECLASGVAADQRLLPIVVDNGSSDGTVQQVGALLASHRRSIWRGTAAELNRADGSVAAPWGALPPDAVLIEAGQNLGFAAGANLGLHAARAAGCAITVFLNNDTVVEADALQLIASRLLSDPALHACIPMITVHGTDAIWNCGGRVHRLGFRRYFLAGRPRREGSAAGEIACSFFTGCCVALRTEPFVARGGFCTRFFFGEEDFELALWMLERGLQARCLTSAVVRHKVSASARAAAGPRQNARVFIYYLNRFVHMRLRLGRPAWLLWVLLYLPYIALLLRRTQRLDASALGRFLRQVVARAWKIDRVTRDDFEAAMAGRVGL